LACSICWRIPTIKRCQLRRELILFGFSVKTRRKRLADILKKKALPNVRLSEGLRGSNEDLLRVAQGVGLEGLVAKRLNSVYESGRRSGAWVKVKLTREREFVIGGYTLPEESRKYFGSLLVGYQGPDGLMFAGRVGTGFSEKVLASINAQLQKLRRATCTFVNLPEKSKGRWGQGCEPTRRQRMGCGSKRSEVGPTKILVPVASILFSNDRIPLRDRRSARGLKSTIGYTRCWARSR
jgi:hypothetical protein